MSSPSSSPESSSNLCFIGGEAGEGGPRVHLHCLCRFLRPATGVAGQLSLSSSDESRLSPVRGDLLFSAGLLSASPCSSDASCLSSDLVKMAGADSMSECRNVYFVVLISSVSGVWKPTLFGAGNIGLLCENDIRRYVCRGRGLLVRIDVTLKDCLYGTSDGASIVEAEAPDDEGVGKADSGGCTSVGVTGSSVLDCTLVVSGVSVGFFAFVPLVCGDCVFRKVLRAVGDVADSVSNRRLVAFLPKTGAMLEVLRESFGRFEGVGNVGMFG
jgi:hypothetical protein